MVVLLQYLWWRLLLHVAPTILFNDTGTIRMVCTHRNGVGGSILQITHIWIGGRLQQGKDNLVVPLVRRQMHRGCPSIIPPIHDIGHNFT